MQDSIENRPTIPSRDIPFTRGDMLLMLAGELSVRDRLDQALEALDRDPGRALIDGDENLKQAEASQPAPLRLREAPQGGIVVPEYLYNAWASVQREKPTYLGIQLVAWSREYIKAYDDLSEDCMPAWESDTLIKDLTVDPKKHTG